MSVNFGKGRHIGILAGILGVAVVLILFGTRWLRNNGFNLIGEVAFAFLVIILAIVAYDQLLVR